MKLNPDIVPATIDEAVQLLFDGLSNEERKIILNTSPAGVHMTLGMFLRNTWSMWEDSPMRRDFQARFKLFSHGDDLSGMILSSLWAKVCGTPPVDVLQAERAEEFRAHWLHYGINPETGEKL